MKNTTCHCLLFTFVGVICGHHLSIAQAGNYFSGLYAGSNNTTGSYNAFAGYGAGLYNTIGNMNTAFGHYAAAANRLSHHNTSIGAYAGFNNVSDQGQNVFVGYRAGYYSFAGAQNVILGSDAGYYNSNGSFNIFIGALAGFNNANGVGNIFIGHSAGMNNYNASGNTFIGNFAGSASTTGNRNTFVGSLSGRFVTTSINNSFFGIESGKAVTTGAGNTMLGSMAGIKTTTGNHNVMVGLAAGEQNTTGRENTFVGRVAGLGNSTGYQNSALGFFAGPGTANLFNATAIGYRAIVRVSNAIVLGSVAGQNGAATTVKVGIGTNSPGYLLHVNGVAAKPGGGSWTVASDKRLKKDIEAYKEGLTEVMEINPVWFSYNGKAGLPTEKRHVGVIAQDMQKIAPHTVSEFVYVDSLGKAEKYLDYDANAMAFMLVNAVKELNTQLRTEIQQLQKEVAELRKMVGQNGPVKRNGDGWLGQNYPNPYTRTTVIPYFIPENSNAAELKIYSASGQEVYAIQIMQKGEGEIEISTLSLSAGNYVYHLVIDGQSIDNKKMLLTK